MQIIPIKDLKDGARVSELCHATGGPVHITRNGYADMVIMSSEYFEKLEAAARASSTAALIREGIAALRRGECDDAYQALDLLRDKYDI